MQERKPFEELKLAQSVLESLSGDKSSQSFEAATLDVKWLEDTVPPQLQLCWDNLNLRSKHKFERQKDNYYDNNFDWMASIWLQERVSANHMEHSSGKPLKQPIDLAIQDFVPTSEEKNYIFTSLTYYYASRLVDRHPQVYKSMNSAIKVYIL